VNEKRPISRDGLLLILALALLVAGGALLAKWLARRHAEMSPPPGYSQLWRCRADGYEADLPPEAIAKLFTEGKHRRDPENPWITLFECPRCGALELEVVTRTPEGTFDLKGPVDQP
jgi:hypothetical protein